MPPLYELIFTLAVFFGVLGFVAGAHPDAGTQTALIALATGIVGSFIRGMSPSGAASTSTTPTTPTQPAAPKAQ